MPINSCTINAYTINSLKCRRHHGEVIPQPLISKKEKGHVYHNPGSSFWNREDEDFVPQNLENSIIKMTITLDGKSHEQIFDNNFNDLIPLVTLKQLTINTNDIPSIEITNLRHE